MWSNEFCILQRGETALNWACNNGESETLNVMAQYYYTNAFLIGFVYFSTFHDNVE